MRRPCLLALALALALAGCADTGDEGFVIRDHLAPDGSGWPAQVVATATVYGQLGGSQVEGLSYTYPVTVCAGSPLAGDRVVNVVGACSTKPAGFMPRAGNPCNPFQDAVLDCCTEGTALACPSVGTML